MSYTSKFTGLLGALASSVILCAQLSAASFPSTIPLPEGWAGEGIAVGRGTDFYVGSVFGPFQGAIYKGDLRTGKGAELVPPNPERQSVGMKLDTRSNWLFVCGGVTGAAYIYDGSTGAEVASFQAAPPYGWGNTFVNDVTLTRDAAYFTDSFRPVIYRVALVQNGALPQPPVFETIPLSGDWGQSEGDWGANGIAATSDGRGLLVVGWHGSGTGLYRVNPKTGYVTRLELDYPLMEGDGILLEGNICYLATGQTIEVISLDPTLSFGSKLYEITSPSFVSPTTIARFGNSLYAVNAFFDSNVVKVSR
jgi:hypothetical protein